MEFLRSVLDSATSLDFYHSIKKVGWLTVWGVSISWLALSSVSAAYLWSSRWAGEVTATIQSLWDGLADDIPQGEFRLIFSNQSLSLEGLFEGSDLLKLPTEGLTSILDFAAPYEYLLVLQQTDEIDENLKSLLTLTPSGISYSDGGERIDFVTWSTLEIPDQEITGDQVRSYAMRGLEVMGDILPALWWLAAVIGFFAGLGAVLSLVLLYGALAWLLHQLGARPWRFSSIMKSSLIVASLSWFLHISSMLFSISSFSLFSLGFILIMSLILFTLPNRDPS